MSPLKKRQPQREEVQKAVTTLQERNAPNVTFTEDALFDEVSLQEFLKGGLSEEWRTSETPLRQRWSTVVMITHFKESDIPHTHLARLASVLIQGNNNSQKN